jgi:hypothetical protein
LNKALRRIVSPAAFGRRRVGDRCRLPGVISPRTSAVATAFIARDAFCGDGSPIIYGRELPRLCELRIYSMKMALRQWQ